jgi:2-(1,2-epoxy-1,2-dihydrophenyl)acetyl-CoA isomerase
MTMTQTFETVQYDAADGVARIVLNRPDSLNGWTRQFGEDLLAALDATAMDDAVRVVVITGAGRAFSVGADLKAGGEFGPDGKPDVATRLRAAYNPLISRVRMLPKPVIAAVNGPAAGIGCSLALACDLIVAAESAYFLLAFVNVGLTIDGGASATLPARLGHARAFELAYLGERLPAAKALEWGLVNRVVADADLHAEAGALAAKLAAGPPNSYANTKELINRELYPDFAGALEAETVLQQQRAQSADFMEGAMAFLQKRPPAFTGD